MENQGLLNRITQNEKREREFKKYLQVVNVEERSFQVKTDYRNLIYVSRSLENCADAVRRICPGEHFEVFNEMGKAIFSSRENK